MGNEYAFGLRDPNKPLYSSTWFVRASETKRDVYIGSRDIGKFVKVSLHDSGDWRIAYTPKGMDVLPERPATNIIDQWEPTDPGVKLPGVPVHHGFAIVLSWFSLGNGLPKKPNGVDWTDGIPPVNEAWQFTTLVAESGQQTAAPDTRAMNATLLKEFTLGDGASVWLMRKRLSLSKQNMETAKMCWEGVASVFASKESTNPQAVYRGHAILEPMNGLHSIMEVAVSKEYHPGVVSLKPTPT